MPVAKNPNILTNRELAKIISSMRHINSRDAATQISNVFSGIIECIRNGYDVNIYGFGKFKVQDTEQYEAIDVYNNSVVVVPKRRHIKFKISRNLLLELEKTSIHK